MRALIVLMIAFALSACATPQSVPITAKSSGSVAGFATLARFGTYEMELAPAYTRLAALRHRAARDLDAGRITVDTAIAVQSLADQSRSKLDAARRGDMIAPTPEQRLLLADALVLMDQIERLLEK